MLSESQHFFNSVLNNGIQGSFAGSEVSSVSYGTYESIQEDSALLSFMLRSAPQWVDLGYLKPAGRYDYTFTDKVEKERHILLRLMEKEKDTICH